MIITHVIFISIKIDLTTIFDEEKKDNWQTSTVILTTDHFDQFTNENTHLSSKIMKTKQSNEQRTTMKPYPPSNTIVNEQTTTLKIVQTTSNNQKDTELLTTDPITTMTRTEIQHTTPITMTSLPITTDEFSTTVFVTNNIESERLPESSISINDDIAESTSPMSSSERVSDTSTSSSTTATTTFKSSKKKKIGFH